MKKLFTLTLAILASFSLWAADVKTYTFDDEVALSTDWEVVTDVPSGGSAVCEITSKLSGSNFAARDPESKYLGLAYLNKSGVGITITSKDSYKEIESIALDAVASDNSKPTFAVYVVTSEGDVEVLAPIGSKDGFGTSGTNKWGSKTITLASKVSGKIKIVTTASSSGKYAAIDNIQVTHTNCTDPNATFTISKTSAFVGETAHMEFNTDNAVSGYDVTVTRNGVAAELAVDYMLENPSMTTAHAEADVKALKAGTFVVTATQTSDGTYCAVDMSVTIEVSEATPVTTVTIDGPSTGYVGVPITLTANAEGATEWLWCDSDNSPIAGATESTYTFTPDKAGTWKFNCKARNSFNGETSGFPNWASSDIKFITVSQLSGVIFEHLYESGSGNIDKDYTATGLIGGTGHQKTQKNKKLGSNGHYISLKLANGMFLADDTVKIIVTPEYNSSIDSYSAPSTIKLSSDLDNTDFIGEASLTVDPASSANIPVAIVITKDVETIYLSRTASFGQNPIVDSIVVIRPVDDGSPVLKVNKESVNVSVTAESPTATAKFAYFGKHLTPGTYSINTGSFPASAFWDYSPKNVTVGADGKLNEEISVTFNGEGGSGSTIPEYLSITFGLAINSQSVSTLVVCDFDMDKDYINASVNIEQLILDHGKSYDIVKDLMSAEINYLKIDALDSLADKEGRNEPYLGLKLQKATDAMIGGWVKKDDVLRVKFGNIPDAVLVTINDAAPVEITDHVYELTATEDTYVKFAPKGTGSKLVVKQMMLNQAIAEVTLPDEPTAIDNAEMDAKVVKIFENGQLVIIKNGVKYNAQGAIVK